VLLIWSGVQLALIVAFVPETYHPVILRRKAAALRAQTGDKRWYAPIEKLDRSVAGTVMWSCIRPFQLLLLEPMVSQFRWFTRSKRAFALLRSAHKNQRTIAMRVL